MYFDVMYWRLWKRARPRFGVRSCGQTPFATGLCFLIRRRALPSTATARERPKKSAEAAANAPAPGQNKG